MKRLTAWLLNPPVSAPKATILIRLMAGGVFLWEGILKFVYTNQGVGRFTKIGIPAPHVTAAFVGGLEIVGGILLIGGFLTRFISIPFVIEMLVAMATTKIALYLGTSPLPLPPALPKVGIWAVLHEVRSEYAQMMSVLFLGIVGPGPWSLDSVLARFRAEALEERDGLGARGLPASSEPGDGRGPGHFSRDSDRLASRISGRSESAWGARARSLAE